jgi:hypothetical protein
MRQHARRGRRAPRDPAEPRPRARRHPIAVVVGLFIVLAVVGAAAYAGWSLYSSMVWESSARETANAVAETVQSYSARDDSPPAPVDAVAVNPGPDQVAIDDLPYGSDLPTDITRMRITDAGALSVLTTSEAMCAGVTLDMSAPGKDPAGSFTCGEAAPPPQPAGLTATARDSGVILDWPHPRGPVEDYTVSVSADDGATWTPYDDGVLDVTQANVRPLVNGRDYLFRVAAVNLVGESAPAQAGASPFSVPGAPTNVRAVGGFSAIVTWTPPVDDGGRPVTSYLVKGDPVGSCTVAAPATRCELDELPAAPGYTFTVRAINERGAGETSSPSPDPIAVYSVPGRPVALTAAAGDTVAVLTWTDPLEDGNTPITDYLVEYRAVGQETWTRFAHPQSAETTQTVTGLVNGTEYEFQVLAVNAVGTSSPPLTTAFAIPATVPDAVPSLERAIGNTIVTLTWTPPAFDGDAEVVDYVIEYRSAGQPWRQFAHPASPALTRDVTDLKNGTRYAFRVAAVNRMGQGPWSPRILGMPVGPPGPVVEPESVGSRKAIELSWLPPLEDGGRPILGYRIDYKLTADPDWIKVARIPSSETTITVEDLKPGESYDFRIVAINKAGFGPPAPQPFGQPETPEQLDQPTLAGVIADETPPAPAGLTAIPGDRKVTLRWEESPAGPKSPIVAYTVTGDPAGTCTTAELTCVVRGLKNGVTYSFTVAAENSNILGPESAPVTATPMVFNAATGGIETTYVKNGRTYRVHTFTAGSTFTVTSAAQPFSVLVVGGGGGSVVAADGTVFPGGGGGIINARRIELPTGTLNVGVGAGGPPGGPGGVSFLDYVGSTPAGAAGSPAQTEFSPTSTSSITGTRVVYGGTGTPTSGPGTDGLGTGAGGPAPNRGGNGVVIIRYEVGG